MLTGKIKRAICLLIVALVASIFMVVFTAIIIGLNGQSMSTPNIIFYSILWFSVWSFVGFKNYWN